jgi:Leucine-rich repeat (LRR) protein
MVVRSTKTEKTYEKFSLFHSYLLTCFHSSAGPFVRNLKITQSHRNATNAENVKIEFRPSNHIFAGIAENFPKLKILRIVRQKIKSIERENFADLWNLKELWLDGNEIQSLNENVFEELTNLQILDIKNNKLTSLPEHMWKIFMKTKNFPFFNLDMC